MLIKTRRKAPKKLLPVLLVGEMVYCTLCKTESKRGEEEERRAAKLVRCFGFYAKSVSVPGSALKGEQVSAMTLLPLAKSGTIRCGTHCFC